MSNMPLLSQDMYNKKKTSNLGFRIFVQELCHVCHDGPLIRFLDVHIFSIQQPGDAKLTLGHIEGVFQSLPVCLPPHLSQVDEICFDSVDNCEERDTVAPGRSEVGYLDI